MKKSLIALLAIIVLLTFASCTKNKLKNLSPEQRSQIEEKYDVTLPDVSSEVESIVESSEPATTTQSTTPSVSSTTPKTESKPKTETSKPATSSAPKTETSKPYTPPSNPPASVNAGKADEAAVADAIVKHINLLRGESATKLPKLTLMAQERSVQLIQDFNHNLDKQKVIETKYGYGRVTREAIGYVTSSGTIDDVAKKVAEGFKNSSSHWAYVGSSSYQYIGVGVTVELSGMGNIWNVSILMCTTNQYE